MELLLLVSPAFAPCRDAERVWQTVATETGGTLRIMDINSAEGQKTAERLHVAVVPAVVLDGRLLAIGVQSAEEARKLIEGRE